jgi:hypothetical protein
MYNTLQYCWPPLHSNRYLWTCKTYSSVTQKFLHTLLCVPPKGFYQASISYWTWNNGPRENYEFIQWINMNLEGPLNNLAAYTKKYHFPISFYLNRVENGRRQLIFKVLKPVKALNYPFLQNIWILSRSPTFRNISPLLMAEIYRLRTTFLASSNINNYWESSILYLLLAHFCSYETSKEKLFAFLYALIQPKQEPAQQQSHILECQLPVWIGL